MSHETSADVSHTFNMVMKVIIHINNTFTSKRLCYSLFWVHTLEWTRWWRWKCGEHTHHRYKYFEFRMLMSTSKYLCGYASQYHRAKYMVMLFNWIYHSTCFYRINMYWFDIPTQMMWYQLQSVRCIDKSRIVMN